MRLVGRFPEERQVSSAVDSLRNAGFDRGDMIISNLAQDREANNAVAATEKGITFVKTERDGLGETEPFAEGVKGIRGETGILVAVKAPRHEIDKVRTILVQSGAVEIVQD